MSRARKSFWSVVAMLVLVDTCSTALVGRVGRGKRDIGSMMSGFLAADDETQLGYLASGLDLMEEGIINYLGDISDRQEAQDRILLENVQVKTLIRQNCYNHMI